MKKDHVLDALEEYMYGLVPKVSRADFLKCIREGAVTRNQLKGMQERLLRLGVPLQRSDEKFAWH